MFTRMVTDCTTFMSRAFVLAHDGDLNEDLYLDDVSCHPGNLFYLAVDHDLDDDHFLHDVRCHHDDLVRPIAHCHVLDDVVS